VSGSHEFEIRIAYADTDRMGVVYYANYLVLFERGRTELMRSLGLRYKDLEDKRQIFLPAMEASCRYVAPAHYDDLITVRTSVCEMGAAHLSFSYMVVHSETKKPLAYGFSKHPFVDRSWKPVRVPPDLRSLIEPCVQPQPPQR